MKELAKLQDRFTVKTNETKKETSEVLRVLVQDWEKSLKEDSDLAQELILQISEKENRRNNEVLTKAFTLFDIRSRKLEDCVGDPRQAGIIGETLINRVNLIEKHLSLAGLVEVARSIV